MLPQNLIFFKENQKGPQPEILFVILGLFKQPLFFMPENNQSDTLLRSKARLLVIFERKKGSGRAGKAQRKKRRVRRRRGVRSEER